MVTYPYEVRYSGIQSIIHLVPIEPSLIAIPGYVPPDVSFGASHPSYLAG